MVYVDNFVTNHNGTYIWAKSSITCVFSLYYIRSKVKNTHAVWQNPTSNLLFWKNWKLMYVMYICSKNWSGETHSITGLCPYIHSHHCLELLVHRLVYLRFKTVIIMFAYFFAKSIVSLQDILVQKSYAIWRDYNLSLSTENRSNITTG